MKKVLFYNGQVFTVNQNDEIVEAVLIEGNKIKHVGASSELYKLADEDTTCIDLEGKALLPGFIDAHCHIASTVFVENTEIVDFFATAQNGVHSISDLQMKVKEAVSKHQKDEWIIASFYNQNALKEERHITRIELDEVSPDNPVVLLRECGHVGVFNTKGLEKIHFFERENEFDKAHIYYDENGFPNGVLKEKAFLPNLKYVCADYSDDFFVDWLGKMGDRLSQLGITSIHDAGGLGTETFRHYQLAVDKGVANFRTYVMGGYYPLTMDQQVENCRDYIKGGFYSGFGNEKLRMGPAKLLLDGSTSGPSSSMKEPYCHDGKQFPMTLSVEEIEDTVLFAHKNHFQFTSHAVGDLTVDTLVTAYEKAMQMYPRNNCRHRIEHCGFATPDVIERIKKLDLIPIANPAFIYFNGSKYNQFYGERTNYMFPQKTMLDQGVMTAVGSDYPVTPLNPIYGLIGMLERQDGRTKEAVGEMQKLDILQAIRAATYNGAYASFEENIKGSIEEGKLADLVVLSKPLLNISSENLHALEVEMTMFDGRIVYEKN